jgi:superfamily II DNA or RNA helicase
MPDEASSLTLKIQRRYRNGPDNIGRDFIGPCLGNSILYRRGTGFFSSGALVAYASALDHLISERTKIQIICSPVIHDKTLLGILKGNLTPEQRAKTVADLSNNLILRALGYKLDTNRRDYKKDLLAYFIAKGILEVRFAVPRNFDQVLTSETDDITSNLYHVKTGYFKLIDGSTVGFDGSFNESDSGHQYHVDQTQVWRSWVDNDRERLSDVIDTVDADWDGKNPYIKIYKMSEEAIALAQKMSPQERPNKNTYLEKKFPTPPITSNESTENGLRDYQLAALQKWKAAGYHGILSMATGTGKTRTAIAAIAQFKAKIPNGLVVITVPYQALAYQWMHELGKQNLTSIKVFDSKGIWESRVTNMIEMHLSRGADKQNLPIFVCVNRTFNDELFQSLLQRLDAAPANNRMVIVDECHHFNNESGITKLPQSFIYRIGLSATPYQADEEQFLTQYFGEIVFEFSLKKAIEEGFLCNYRYHPIFIELSVDEANKYIELSKKIQQDSYSNDVEQPESSYNNQLEGLLETVVAKLSALKDVLIKAGPQPYSLFYCGTGSIEFTDGTRMRQINSLSRMLDELGWRVSKITAEESPSERETIFEYFRGKQLDAITSIKVLDEGIDIPDCRFAYILASQKSERQGIQRRGRILRKAPGKEISELFDFIITGPKLSNVELERLYSRELLRARMFAEDALNKQECIKKISLI